MKSAHKVICTCKHDFQDKEHGKQVRVATPTKGGTPERITVRCTVCCKQQDVKR